MRDKVHQHVVNALRKDGWTITDDPLKVVWKERKLNVDLGASLKPVVIAGITPLERAQVERRPRRGKSDCGGKREPQDRR